MTTLTYNEALTALHPHLGLIEKDRTLKRQYAELIANIRMDEVRFLEKNPQVVKKAFNNQFGKRKGRKMNSLFKNKPITKGTAVFWGTIREQLAFHYKIFLPDLN